MAPGDAELSRTIDVVNVRSALVRSAEARFAGLGATEVRVPTLVRATGACEDVASVFGVEDSGGRVLSQTGQLVLETLLSVVEDVWCVTVSYRRDPPDDRHLEEFELLEEEMAVTRLHEEDDAPATFQCLLERIEALIKGMVDTALTDCSEQIRRLGGDSEKLARAVDVPFATMTYDEAIHDLAQLDEHAPTWGDDLTASHEALLLASRASGRVRRPLFVTRFPQHLKYFNMLVDREDPRVVFSADLILPWAGEAVGAALREWDPDRLTRRFDDLMLPRLASLGEDAARAESAFRDYLALARDSDIPRHAGYGVGIERVLQFVTGASDIRLVSAVSRLG
jgi:asparaginyl-tRNA synthetase